MRYDNFTDLIAALPQVTSTWLFLIKTSRQGVGVWKEIFEFFRESYREVNVYIMALTIKQEISDDSAVSSEGEKDFLKVKKRKNKKKR